MHRQFHRAFYIGNFQTWRSNCVYEFLHQVSSMSSWKRSFPILTLICGKLYITSGNVRLLSVPSVWVLFSVEFPVVTAIAYIFRNSFPVVFGLRTEGSFVQEPTTYAFIRENQVFYYCVRSYNSVCGPKQQVIYRSLRFIRNSGSSTSLAVSNSHPVTRRTGQTIRCSSILCSKCSICVRIVKQGAL